MRLRPLVVTVQTVTGNSLCYHTSKKKKKKKKSAFQPLYSTGPVPQRTQVNEGGAGSNNFSQCVTHWGHHLVFTGIKEIFGKRSDERKKRRTGWSGVTGKGYPAAARAAIRPYNWIICEKRLGCVENRLTVFFSDLRLLKLPKASAGTSETWYLNHPRTRQTWSSLPFN
ncbi:hypothetical protein B0H14DRAFT_2628315 [Mycena olivaceomarginata]|nr:hypothetical protein B0H14DRAFT_2628315 [Mycena olivaceomarginata]